MTSTAQDGCKVKETTLLHQFFVPYWQYIVNFGHKIGQNLYGSIVSAKICWRGCDVVFNCTVIKLFL